MAEMTYWYDAICLGIVGVAVLVSVYVLWTRERERDGDSRVQLHALLEPTSTSHTTQYNNSNRRLWSSCWRGLHPVWLLAFRLTSFFVLAAFLSWDIRVWGASIFIYYTEWTFTLVMLYFAIGSLMSGYSCWLHYYKATEESRCRKRLKFWGYLMQTAYQTCAGAVILTDIVFWGIIVPFLSNSRLRLNLLMGCMHTVNVVLLLIDTSINGLPFPWFRLAYFVLWSSAYVVFQWLIHLFGFSWWPYPFLEPSTASAPLCYSILAVSHVASYGLYALIVRLKDSVFSRIFPVSYIR